MVKLVWLLLVCLTALPALADEAAGANRLVVEAVKMIKAAETVEGTADKLALLEGALAKLNEIVERHLSSDVAVKLVTDQSIDSLSFARLRGMVEELRARGSREEPIETDEDCEDLAAGSYLDTVFRKIERHEVYPMIAARSGLEGRVVLRFTLRRDGEVLNPEVVEVSGHRSFRRAALQGLARASLLPSFPDGIRRAELLVEVPLTFRATDLE